MKDLGPVPEGPLLALIQDYNFVPFLNLTFLCIALE